jgi:MFS family permease
LASTVAVSFGSLFYAYSVLITDEAAGGRFSTSVLSTAYAGFVLFGGVLAFVVGRTADRHGVRPLVAVGSLLGGTGLVVVSVAAEAWQIVAASWLLMGPAGAMTFYEPAFVAVDQWFEPKTRGPAISLLTVVGGLAGPIFLPLTGALVESIGWRPTARVLALVLVLTGLVASFLLPAHVGEASGGRKRPTLRSLVGERHFVLFTIAIVLSFGALQAVFFHRIAVFEDAGFSVGLVAAWGGIASLLSFPGRFGAPLLRGRLGGLHLFAALALVLGGAVLIMVAAAETWQMIAHFVVFGLAFGGLLPLRAVVMGRWYSGSGFGSIMGAQWSLAAVAGAGGPWLVGLSRDAFGSYDGPMIVIAGAFATAGVLTFLASRGIGDHDPVRARDTA